ncbi:alpha/beta hydrolase [Pseudoalteromonas sp. GB56]
MVRNHHHHTADYHQEFAQLFISTTENPEDKSLLNFLDKQILTYIDKQYRTNGFRIYSGFMGNAAFGLYALLNQPTLFNAYFLASPSIQDDFLGVNSTALNKLEALTDKQRFVYINIGEHNYEKGSIEAVKAFEHALQAKAPTQLQWQINFADSSHYMSRPIVTVIEGIERLFWDYHTPLAPDSDVSKQGVQAIIDYYRALSANKYGFEVSAESSLSALAKYKLADEPKQSIKIYQHITQLYPDSAYAFANLASAYANGGDLDEAIKLQTKAIDLSKVMVPWHQKNIEKKLREYERQLGSVNSESP